MALRINYLFAFIFIVLIGVSCGDDPLDPEVPLEEEMPEEEIVPQEWPDEFEALVELFIEEGQKRGVLLDADELTMLFVDEFSTSDVNPQTCGYGWWNFFGTGERRVEILNTDACWHGRSDLEKENFMFHELGHALLSLEHTFGQFPNGTPNSIMCSFIGLNSCNNYDVYHQTREMRDYYLDQLFDSRTSSPSWTRNSIDNGSIFSDSIEWSDQVIEWDSENKESAITLSVASDESSNHQLEIEVSKDPNGDDIGLFNTSIERPSITDCYALKVEFDYTYTGELEGDIQVWIGIHREEENGDFNTIKTHDQEYSVLELAYSGKLDAEIYCVPEEANYIVISLGLKPTSNGTMTFSNVEVSQYD